MKGIVCLLILLLMAGCADKNKVPSGIIPPGKMGSIIWDMMEADEYSALYLAKDTLLVKDSIRSKSPGWAKDSVRIKDSALLSLKLSTLQLYQQVFQLHEVSREDFRKSYQYYAGRPDLSRRLFDSVLSLSNRERNASLNALGSKKGPPVIPNPAQHPTQAPQFFPNRPGGKIPLLPPGHVSPQIPAILRPQAHGQHPPGSSPHPNPMTPGAAHHKAHPKEV